MCKPVNKKCKFAISFADIFIVFNKFVAAVVAVAVVAAAAVAVSNIEIDERISGAAAHSEHLYRLTFRTMFV